jgi:hypothetical protein
MSETRTIHTGLYSNRADALIREIITDLQEAYYGAKKTKKMASLFNSEVQRGIDNEILITSTADTYWGRKKRLWNGLTDKQVLCHIIWLYKLLIIKRAGKDSWKRGCAATIPWSDSDFKISEVYFVYDMFHQRKNFKRNYPQNYSDNLIGIPLDPITIELKNAQLDEIKKIINEKKHKIEELNTQKSRERDAAYKVIDMKYGTLIKEVEDMAATKIKQLKEEMKGIASLNLLANVG